jgi:hypothetical protein
MGNGSQMRPGEVQLMSAGTGVTHSEFNPSDEEVLELLQMWVHPRSLGTAPRYEQKEFPAADRQGRLRLVVSPDGADGSLTIGQDVRLYSCLLAAGETVGFELAAGRAAWLHLALGRIRLNGAEPGPGAGAERGPGADAELGPGDGAAIRSFAALQLEGVSDANLILWDLPAE